MLQPWERLGDETLTHFKVFKVVRSLRRSPRNGAEVGFFLLETWDWVNIVAITKNQELIMVRQFRQGTDEETLEIPGGVLHSPDEDPADAAHRELREETGHVAGELRLLGATCPNPAIQNNRITTYLATNCEAVGGLQQDSGDWSRHCESIASSLGVAFLGLAVTVQLESGRGMPKFDR